MGSSWFLVINFDYIFPILCLQIWLTILWINKLLTKFKFTFIFVILLYSKFSEGMNWNQVSLIRPLPAKIFYNKLAPSIPNNIPWSRPLCSFISFSILLLKPLMNKPECSRGVTMTLKFFDVFYFVEFISIVVP